MKDITFEKAFEKLEKTVEELESGEFPLDSSLKKYEEGIKMARLCQQKLDKAKARIETLMKKGEGVFELENFKEEK
jgi:exodeoxyribonuclease VII small subunit